MTRDVGDVPIPAIAMLRMAPPPFLYTHPRLA